MSADELTLDLDIGVLRNAYANQTLTPRQVVSTLLDRIERTRQYNAWIHVLSDTQLTPYLDRLTTANFDDLPLWGIPFAIKDNIDLANIPTTAACHEFAYTPDSSATVVQRLIDAGAVPLGKTNLDQFATGLVGVRSPYGAIRNAVEPSYISGGSSGGSAVAVRLNLCSFALGTDTAGSGRVPAALQGLVGLKPSRGWWSTRGVVPACRTLDCVSVFTRTALDATAIANVAGAFDPDDPFARELAFAGFDTARPRYGVLAEASLTACDTEHRAAYLAQAQRLPGAIEIDPTPLFAAARLLYEGPWVAERYAAIAQFLATQSASLHPTTAAVILPGVGPSAVDMFQAQYQLAELQRATQKLFSDVDVIMMPTIPTLYTIAAVERDPIATNSHLGVYTNFVNLLDLSAIALPAGALPNGMPFGITLIAQAGRDYALLDLAADFAEKQVMTHPRPLPKARPGEFFVAVCGAHMTGEALNHQLTDRGGYRIYRGPTSAHYRLYALPDNKRPALVRDEAQGRPIEVEVWSIAERSVGSFLRGIQPPLGLGSIELTDGSWVNGFIAEPMAIDRAREITAFGSWIRYRQSL